MFKICELWTVNCDLVIWTQPSGPLCLCQCFIPWLLFFATTIEWWLVEGNNHKSCLVTSEPLSDAWLLQSLLIQDKHHHQYQNIIFKIKTSSSIPKHHHQDQNSLTVYLQFAIFLWSKLSISLLVSNIDSYYIKNTLPSGPLCLWQCFVKCVRKSFYLEMCLEYFCLTCL